MRKQWQTTSTTFAEMFGGIRETANLRRFLWKPDVGEIKLDILTNLTLKYNIAHKYNSKKFSFKNSKCICTSTYI